MTGIPGASFFNRLLAALPDALSALGYAWTWCFPLWFGHDTVKNLMLVMLMEFLVIHSGAFIGLTVLSDSASRRAKSATIIGFGAFYMLFAVAFSLAFHSWWPALCFLWLLGSKFVLVWLAPLPRAEESARMKSLWVASAVCYLLAVFVGVLLWLPRLGLGPDVVATLGLEGGGLWIEKPHTVMASGFLYFAAVAWTKWAYRPGWGAKISGPP